MCYFRWTNQRQISHVFTEVQILDSQDYMYVFKWMSIGITHETRKENMRCGKCVEETGGIC